MNSLSAKIHYLLVFIPLFVIISCNDDQIVYPEGGYSYLKNISSDDTNFYFLPIRKTISKRDSIYFLDFKYQYHGFNEPNLSTTPPKEDVVRFLYDGPDISAIITLTKNKITIKRNKSGYFHPAPDESHLDSIEKLHYDLLIDHYPLTEAKFSVWRKKYVDSLIKIYPELLFGAYYQKLIDKVFSIDQGPFEYSVEEIKISTAKFKYFANLINESGYWQLPYLRECNGIMGNPGSFILETITKSKYKMIYSISCPGDTSKFTKACQELVKYAKMDKEINLVWNWKKSSEKVQIRELQLMDLKP